MAVLIFNDCKTRHTSPLEDCHGNSLVQKLTHRLAVVPTHGDFFYLWMNTSVAIPFTQVL